MRIMFDANILLDVFQNRQPHYAASARCVDRVLRERIDGSVPAHVLTTFYYMLRKHRDPDTARDAVRWMLGHFGIASCDRAMFEAALRYGMADFEDAVVAVSAERAGCAHILTRNPGDFAKSPVPAISPAELLETSE